MTHRRGELGEPAWPAGPGPEKSLVGEKSGSLENLGQRKGQW